MQYFSRLLAGIFFLHERFTPQNFKSLFVNRAGSIRKLQGVDQEHGAVDTLCALRNLWDALRQLMGVQGMSVPVMVASTRRWFKCAANVARVQIKPVQAQLGFHRVNF
jgi:hypothetical protein